MGLATMAAESGCNMATQKPCEVFDIAAAFVLTYLAIDIQD
jgi:hypothetical protein